MSIDEPARPRYAADDRVTLAEASELTGRDRKTLMQDIRDGRFPHHAQQVGGRRAHSLLVQDLVDAGLVSPDRVLPATGMGAQGALNLSSELRVVELEVRLHAQDALVQELRAEVVRLNELAHALIARTPAAEHRPRSR